MPATGGCAASGSGPTNQTAWALDLQLFWGANAGQLSTNNGDLQAQLIQTCNGAGYTVANNYYQGYSYDGLNRLMAFKDENGADERDFKYDKFGNLWVTANTGTFPPLSASTPRSNIYSSNKRSDTTYDAAGNETSIAAICAAGCLQYDAESRQTGYTPSGTSYSYDGDGRRIISAANGVNTVFVYDATGNLAAKYTSGVGGTVPCTTCYLSWDHLGSTRMVTEQSGNLVARHDYLAFGEEIRNGYAGRPSNGTWGGLDTVSQKFTGKERDPESGLDYFGARYYGASLGRFTSADEVFADQDENDPQSWNLYNYVRNNPLRYSDADGRACTYDQATNNFTRDCSSAGDEQVTQAGVPQTTTVGVGSDEANLIMLSTIGDALTDPHTYAQFVSDAGRAAASLVWPGASGVAECITPGGNCDKTNLAMVLLPGALGNAGRAIRILEEAGGVIHLEIKTAQGTDEVVANVTREGDKIVLEGALIQGSGAGQFGPGLLRELRAAARQFMEQEGASAVEVRPAVRTSGANPGRAMRPFTVTR